MEIKKSAMIVDGNTVRMSMPFAKVDEAQRLVSGFATLDNIDTQGDIVLADASMKAFHRTVFAPSPIRAPIDRHPI